MGDTLEPYRVLRRPGELPDGDGAGRVFASLFDEQPDPETLSTLSFVMPPGTHRASHRHTADIAAGVVSGEVTFVFGADGTGRVELGPGDYVWIRDGVMHDEETADGVELLVAHLRPFETLGDA